jgi:hypothetical protein
VNDLQPIVKVQNVFVLIRVYVQQAFVVFVQFDGFIEIIFEILDLIEKIDVEAFELGFATPVFALVLFQVHFEFDFSVHFQAVQTLHQV